MNLKWLKTVARLAPMIIHTIRSELDPIGSVIGRAMAEAEQIPGATGKEKFDHVKNIATQTATAINESAGKQIVPVESLDEALQEGADTTVAVVNLIHNK